MLKVEQLSAGYGRLEVLHNVSFEVPARTIIAILGANGAGKTTLMRALMGQIRLHSGKITLEGSPIEHLSVARRVKYGIALVPEGRELFRSLTVRENLLMGAFITHSHQERDASLARVLDYFPRLKTHLDAQAASLSGGEGQMLAIGRALMSRPRLLLLDEPSLGLAPVIVDTVFDVVTRLQQEEQLSVVLVEQNIRKALRIASTAYILQQGMIALHGETQDLAHDPTIQALYLGG